MLSPPHTLKSESSYLLWLRGASVPGQTEKLFGSHLHHLEKVRPDRLVLLGDVKHNVPITTFQERSEVPAFLRALSELAPIDMVLGNHNVGLFDLAPPGTKILPPEGHILDRVGYFHGHTWPHPKLFESETLVATRLHPSLQRIPLE